MLNHPLFKVFFIKLYQDVVSKQFVHAYIITGVKQLIVHCMGVFFFLWNFSEMYVCAQDCYHSVFNRETLILVNSVILCPVDVCLQMHFIHTSILIKLLLVCLSITPKTCKFLHLRVMFSVCEQLD